MEVALDKPFCRLIHFKSSSETKRKVLLVPRSRATTRRCCATPCARSSRARVWVTDWVDARMVPLSAAAVSPRRLRRLLREWITLLSSGPARHLGVPSDGARACRRIPAVLQQASCAQYHGDDGRADRCAAQPDRGQPTSPSAKPISWFEQTLIHRVPPSTRATCAASTGVLQHLGFVAMNPDRHMNAHWDYFNH